MNSEKEALLLQLDILTDVCGELQEELKDKRRRVIRLTKRIGIIDREENMEKIKDLGEIVSEKELGDLLGYDGFLLSRNDLISNLNLPFIKVGGKRVFYKKDVLDLINKSIDGKVEIKESEQKSEI